MNQNRDADDAALYRLDADFVTSVRQLRDVDELRRLPHSGGIFSMRVDVPGVPEARFPG